MSPPKTAVAASLLGRVLWGRHAGRIRRPTQHMPAKMNVIVKTGRLVDEASDALLLYHWEGEPFGDQATAIDAAVKGRLNGLLKSREFTGRACQISILHVAPGE